MPRIVMCPYAYPYCCYSCCIFARPYLHVHTCTHSRIHIQYIYVLLTRCPLEETHGQNAERVARQVTALGFRVNTRTYLQQVLLAGVGYFPALFDDGDDYSDGKPGAATAMPCSDSDDRVLGPATAYFRNNWHSNWACRGGR